MVPVLLCMLHLFNLMAFICSILWRPNDTNFLCYQSVAKVKNESNSVVANLNSENPKPRSTSTVAHKKADFKNWDAWMTLYQIVTPI